MTTDPTEEQVKYYMWPHFDFGKEQLSAFMVAGSGKLKHGDVVQFTDKTKATFRVLDANLYEEDWLRKALPIAKKLWQDGWKKNGKREYGNG